MSTLCFRTCAIVAIYCAVLTIQASATRSVRDSKTSGELFYSPQSNHLPLVHRSSKYAMLTNEMKSLLNDLRRRKRISHHGHQNRMWKTTHVNLANSRIRAKFNSRHKTPLFRFRDIENSKKNRRHILPYYSEITLDNLKAKPRHFRRREVVSEITKTMPKSKKRRRTKQKDSRRREILPKYTLDPRIETQTKPTWETQFEMFTIPYTSTTANRRFPKFIVHSSLLPDKRLLRTFPTDNSAHLTNNTTNVPMHAWNDGEKLRSSSSTSMQSNITSNSSLFPNQEGAINTSAELLDYVVNAPMRAVTNGKITRNNSFKKIQDNISSNSFLFPKQEGITNFEHPIFNNMVNKGNIASNGINIHLNNHQQSEINKTYSTDTEKTSLTNPEYMQQNLSGHTNILNFLYPDYTSKNNKNMETIKYKLDNKTYPFGSATQNLTENDGSFNRFFPAYEQNLTANSKSSTKSVSSDFESFNPSYNQEDFSSTTEDFNRNYWHQNAVDNSGSFNPVQANYDHPYLSENTELNSFSSGYKQQKLVENLVDNTNDTLTHFDHSKQALIECSDNLFPLGNTQSNVFQNTDVYDLFNSDYVQNNIDGSSAKSRTFNPNYKEQNLSGNFENFFTQDYGKENMHKNTETSRSFNTGNNVQDFHVTTEVISSINGNHKTPKSFCNMEDYTPFNPNYKDEFLQAGNLDISSPHCSFFENKGFNQKYNKNEISDEEKPTSILSESDTTCARLENSNNFLFPSIISESKAEDVTLDSGPDADLEELKNIDRLNLKRRDVQKTELSQVTETSTQSSTTMTDGQLPITESSETLPSPDTSTTITSAQTTTITSPSTLYNSVMENEIPQTYNYLDNTSDGNFNVIRRDLEVAITNNETATTPTITLPTTEVVVVVEDVTTCHPNEGPAQCEIPCNMSNTLSEILHNIELLASQNVKSGSLNEDFPCNLNGSWLSEAGGVKFDIEESEGKIHNIVVTPQEVAKHNRHGFMCNSTWNVTGILPMPGSGMIIINGINDKDKTVATFIGELKKYFHRAVIWGHWIINKPPNDNSEESQKTLFDALEKVNQTCNSPTPTTSTSSGNLLKNATTSTIITTPVQTSTNRSAISGRDISDNRHNIENDNSSLLSNLLTLIMAYNKTAQATCYTKPTLEMPTYNQKSWRKTMTTSWRLGKVAMESNRKTSSVEQLLDATTEETTWFTLSSSTTAKVLETTASVSTAMPLTTTELLKSSSTPSAALSTITTPVSPAPVYSELRTSNFPFGALLLRNMAHLGTITPKTSVNRPIQQQYVDELDETYLNAAAASGWPLMWSNAGNLNPVDLQVVIPNPPPYYVTPNFEPAVYTLPAPYSLLNIPIEEEAHMAPVHYPLSDIPAESENQQDFPLFSSDNTQALNEANLECNIIEPPVLALDNGNINILTSTTDIIGPCDNIFIRATSRRSATIEKITTPFKFGVGRHVPAVPQCLGAAVPLLPADDILDITVATQLAEVAFTSTVVTPYPLKCNSMPHNWKNCNIQQPMLAVVPQPVMNLLPADDILDITVATPLAEVAFTSTVVTPYPLKYNSMPYNWENCNIQQPMLAVVSQPAMNLLPADDILDITVATQLAEVAFPSTVVTPYPLKYNSMPYNWENCNIQQPLLTMVPQPAMNLLPADDILDITVTALPSEVICTSTVVTPYALKYDSKPRNWVNCNIKQPMIAMVPEAAMNLLPADDILDITVTTLPTLVTCTSTVVTPYPLVFKATPPLPTKNWEICNPQQPFEAAINLLPADDILDITVTTLAPQVMYTRVETPYPFACNLMSQPPVKNWKSCNLQHPAMAVMPEATVQLLPADDILDITVTPLLQDFTCSSTVATPYPWEFEVISKIPANNLKSCNLQPPLMALPPVPAIDLLPADDILDITVTTCLPTYATTCAWNYEMFTQLPENCLEAYNFQPSVITLTTYRPICATTCAWNYELFTQQPSSCLGTYNLQQPGIAMVPVATVDLLKAHDILDITAPNISSTCARYPYEATTNTIFIDPIDGTVDLRVFGIGQTQPESTASGSFSYMYAQPRDVQFAQLVSDEEVASGSFMLEPATITTLELTTQQPQSSYFSSYKLDLVKKPDILNYARQTPDNLAIQCGQDFQSTAIYALVNALPRESPELERVGCNNYAQHTPDNVTLQAHRNDLSTAIYKLSKGLALEPQTFIESSTNNAAVEPVEYIDNKNLTVGTNSTANLSLNYLKLTKNSAITEESTIEQLRTTKSPKTDKLATTKKLTTTSTCKTTLEFFPHVDSIISSVLYTTPETT